MKPSIKRTSVGVIWLWLFAFAATAFAQIQEPQLGVMLAADHSARPVYGVTSSVTIGDPAATGVLSIGCSKLLCLMKTDSSILSPTGVAAAPSGPALFSFDGNSALIDGLRLQCRSPSGQPRFPDRFGAAVTELVRDLVCCCLQG